MIFLNITLHSWEIYEYFFIVLFLSLSYQFLLVYVIFLQPTSLIHSYFTKYIFIVFSYIFSSLYWALYSKELFLILNFHHIFSVFFIFSLIPSTLYPNCIYHCSYKPCIHARISTLHSVYFYPFNWFSWLSVASFDLQLISWCLQSLWFSLQASHWDSQRLSHSIEYF